MSNFQQAASQPQQAFTCLAPRVEDHEYDVDHGTLNGEWAWFIRTNRDGTRILMEEALKAGVERIVTNPTLVQPLCRMVDPALTAGMVEYVVGHVLRHHLGMDRHILKQAGWSQVPVPLARERRVAMLGMGALGQACAAALQGLGFAVTGWSRTATFPVFTNL